MSFYRPQATAEGRGKTENFEVENLDLVALHPCGITTHVPTPRKRGGISVRERATLGTHASADRSEGLVKKEGTRGR